MKTSTFLWIPKILEMNEKYDLMEHIKKPFDVIFYFQSASPGDAHSIKYTLELP